MTDEIKKSKIVNMTIVVNEKEIHARRPKVKLLRKVVQLNDAGTQDLSYFNTLEGIDSILNLVVDIFDNPELTFEVLCDADMESLFTLQNINDWINQYFPQKKMMEIREVTRMKANQKVLSK